MNVTLEATYENGMLRLDEPLPLKDRERVTVTVATPVTVARRTAGMIPWMGDVEILERVACDPEFSVWETP